MQHPSVFPALTYDDPQAAIDFLAAAFGAVPHAVYAGDDGTIQHAEVRLGNGIVMFGPTRAGQAPAHTGVYVAIENVDEHCERARRAGAEIAYEPRDTEYGSRDYTAHDPEGNTWYFGTYQPFAYHATAEAAAANA